MMTSHPTSFSIPKSCPFSIRLLSNTTSTNSSITRTTTTYLIREHDQYGEYPNIYAKLITTTSPFPASVIVLSDTGCGTQVEHRGDDGMILWDVPELSKSVRRGPTPPEWWDIGTFLDFTINRGDDEEGEEGEEGGEPGEGGTEVQRAPYLIMTTHCHFDHILGIRHLPPTCPCGCGGGWGSYQECYRDRDSRMAMGTDRERLAGRATAAARVRVPAPRLPTFPVPPPSPAPYLTSPKTNPTNTPSLATPQHDRHPPYRRLAPPSTVLSSSAAPIFITPSSALATHSLCESLHLPLPKYDIGIWAQHLQSVIYPLVDPLRGTALLHSNITILHTPGHTPDSLSWYDEDTRTISVGDSFYERETPETKSAPWGREPPMPTIFTEESNLVDWWRSLKVLRDFVVEKEERRAEKEVRMVDVDEGQDTSCDDVSERVGGHADGEWTLIEEVPVHKSDEGTRVLTDPTTTTISVADSATTGANPSASRIPSRIPPQTKKKMRPIMLSAAHVTVNAPALAAIDGIKHFMSRILRDEVPFKQVEDRRGEATGLWDDSLVEGGDGTEFGGDDGRERNEQTGAKDGNDEYYGRKGRWSIMAPIRIVEEGRKGIPREEWA